MDRSRRWWQSVLLLLMLGGAGYLSRKYRAYLPTPIEKRTGDALWACCIFMILAIIRPRWSTVKVAPLTLAVSYTIEFSQIYHRPWIDAIRATLPGRLILGTTFYWRDQLAYTIGVAVLAPFDWMLTSGREPVAELRVPSRR